MTNRHPNSERENDRRDFWLGVLGFALGNALLLLLQSPGPLVTLLNLAAWLLLAAVRPRAAIGVVAALAALFAVGLAAAACFLAACVTAGVSSSYSSFCVILIPMAIFSAWILWRAARWWWQFANRRQHEDTFAGTPPPGSRLSALELQSVRQGLKQDLAGYDLSKLDLSGECLARVNFSRANLHMAILENADLRQAMLRRAFLIEACLVRANLSGADLRKANLCAADLRGADLRGADLRDADLRDANMEGAILDDADFSGAVLPDENESA